jgi:hypothetical protein
MSWTRRLRNLIARQKLERQIDDELAFHIDERVDELVAGGLTPAEARRLALLQFGSYTRRKEDIREIDLLTRIETVIRDLRFGMRSLLGSPAFTATAVLSLALGIGANTAIFSIIDALMLRSLPVEDPARLVKIESRDIGREFTNPIWEQMRDHQWAFSGVLAWSSVGFDLAQGGERHFGAGPDGERGFLSSPWRSRFAGPRLHNRKRTAAELRP